MPRNMCIDTMKDMWAKHEVAVAAGKKEDMVNHPPHYTRAGIECIDAIEAATTDMTGLAAFCTGQAIKYLWRWPWKENKVQDLKKAVWYINKLISHLEGDKNAEAKRKCRELIEEFVFWPLGQSDDLVMAFWFAWRLLERMKKSVRTTPVEQRVVPSYMRRGDEWNFPAQWSKTQQQSFLYGRRDDDEDEEVVNA